MTSFLALTTSPEVISEIIERLPPQFASLTGESSAGVPEKHLLSILPDPQSLSLAEILEFRQLLSGESILDNWRESLTAVLDQLEGQPLREEMWQETRKYLQEQAKGFQQLWPAPGKPSRYLRLECLCYPSMQPKVAFSLASGLKLPAGKMYEPAETNGITLLIYPSEFQPNGRE